MYCPKCGTLNDQRAVNCSRCGAELTPAGGPPPQILQSGVPPQYPPQYQPPMQQPFPPQDVPNYMVQSVLVTLFCCLPLGIMGIVKANKITKMLRMNDFAGAQVASEENKKTLWIAFGVGLAVIALRIIVAVVEMNSH